MSGYDNAAFKRISEIVERMERGEKVSSDEMDVAFANVLELFSQAFKRLYERVLNDPQISQSLVKWSALTGHFSEQVKETDEVLNFVMSCQGDCSKLPLEDILHYGHLALKVESFLDEDIPDISLSQLTYSSFIKACK